MAKPTWHAKHVQAYTPGQRVADATARVLGSWPFIIGQTLFVFAWMALNVAAWTLHWDPYPFILLNLMFSIQAAYAGPVIMMSQNRQSERDRFQAQADYETNVKGEAVGEQILARLSAIEANQLARLMTLAEDQAGNGSSGASDPSA